MIQPRECSNCISACCLLAMHIIAQVKEFGFCHDHTSVDEAVQPYTAEQDLILTEDMLLTPVDITLQEQRAFYERMHPVMPVVVSFNHGTGEYEQKPPFGWGQ